MKNISRSKGYKVNPLFLLIVTLLSLFSLLSPMPVRADETPPPAVGEPVTLEESENTTQFTGCTRLDFEPVNADFEQRVVELVNDERHNQNLPPLKRNRDLDYAARYHARDMAEDNYFAHDSNEANCSWSTRISKFYTGWNSLAENIAAGYSTPESVFNGWMNSEGHRANILSTSNREIGVGYWAGGYYRHYWVQDFGRRSTVYPVVINREYARTDTPDVQLHIYGQGVWTEMRLRNDDGAWTAWQPFQSNLNWRLNWIRGVRTVTVELRNGSQTTQSADTIELTSGEPQLDVQPASLTFFYESSTRRLLPPSASISVRNSGNDLVLNWTVESIEGDWFSISTNSGSTPASLLISPDNNPALFAQNEILSGGLTIRTSGSMPVAGSPKTVGIQLLVVPEVAQVYLPLVKR